MPLVFRSLVVYLCFHAPIMAFQMFWGQDMACPLTENLSVNWWWEQFLRFTVLLSIHWCFRSTRRACTAVLFLKCLE